MVNAVSACRGGREHDAPRRDISRGRSGARRVEWRREDDAGRRFGELVDELGQVQRSDSELARDCAECEPVLVHAVVGAAAVPGVLDRLAIVLVENGTRVVIRARDRACLGVGPFGAHRADHRLGKRAGHQAEKQQRNPAGTKQRDDRRKG